MARLLPTPIAAGALALGVLVAGGASTAVALDAPAISAPASPSRATSWTFTWSAPAADPGFQIAGYIAGADGAVANVGNVNTMTVTLAEGPHTFSVQAVQTSAADGSPGPAGATASVPVRVDTTAPKITATVPRANGLRGWYRLPFTIAFACTDASAVPLCGPNRSVNAVTDSSLQGAHAFPGTATDAAGNTTAISVGPLNIDMLAPADALLSTPNVGAVVTSEPTFTWTRNRSKETSGYEHYDVQVLLSGTWRNVASVPYPANPPDTFSTARNPAVMAAALPERTALQWRVVTWDNAGNQKASAGRAFTIDSTAPGKPTITLGPSGPVREPKPAFSWSGTQPSFAWSVTREGAETPSQAGAGAASTVTLAPLADGDYVFSVSQVSASGLRGAEATRAFTVDTVAPPAPTITARPANPSGSATPGFAWMGEEGSTYRWQVLTSAGASAQSPVETPLGSTTVGPLGPGGYTFRVSQIDPAGNVSGAATESFTIAGAVAPTVKPAVAKLPALRASRLSPKANRTVMTRRPLLSWKRGPAGTTLYNVQVFKVGPKGTSSTKVSKVFSSFPRARHMRAPKGKLKAGVCYVWRVWPYVKSGFTRQPLGVSNFCVGTTAQLKAAARRARR